VSDGAAEPGGTVRVAGWIVEGAGRQLASATGARVTLTRAEARILLALASHPREVVTREQLMAAVAGRAWQPFQRGIDVHVSNLRRKLGADARRPGPIRTVRGAGYMLVPHA
jgi:two-component system OmpR family response regulator